jgi:flagellar biogenesis protein FliO
MNTQDEIIQKQTEEGNAPSNADGEAYRLIFDSLRKDHSYKLPADFAKKVSSIAITKKAFDWDKFFFIIGGLGFVIMLIYSVVSIQATFSIGVFRFFSSYAGLSIFAIVFVVLLNWLDKKFINKASA